MGLHQSKDAKHFFRHLTKGNKYGKLNDRGEQYYICLMVGLLNKKISPDAAGEIHTDFQRGFIKAEVYKYDDLVRLGSEKAVKNAGLAKLQGKDYVVQDGDCIYFHFNV